MSAVATWGAGMSMAMPDVCMTPPFAIPAPFPNIANNAPAIPGHYTIMINGMPELNTASQYAITFGDEGGGRPRRSRKRHRRRTRPPHDGLGRLQRGRLPLLAAHRADPAQPLKRPRDDGGAEPDRQVRPPVACPSTATLRDWLRLPVTLIEPPPLGWSILGSLDDSQQRRSGSIVIGNDLEPARRR